MVSFLQRRCSLEDWIENLLSDIDLSRTAIVANFLELEAAARSGGPSLISPVIQKYLFGTRTASCFMKIRAAIQIAVSLIAIFTFLSAFNSINEQNLDWNPITTDIYPSVASVGVASPSIMSDNGNDSSYQVSELGTPRHTQNISIDFGMEASEHELTKRKDSLKSGISSRNFILDNIEKYSRDKTHTGKESTNASGREAFNDSIGVAYQDEEIPLVINSFKPNNHARRLSAEIIDSDIGSVRASEVSRFSMPNLFADNSLDHPEDTEAVGTVYPVSSDSRMPREFVIALPSEEQQKLNRVLMTAKQRLSTAKTDMEDLIARLNQEVAVRQFLQTKVCHFFVFFLA